MGLAIKGWQCAQQRFSDVSGAQSVKILMLRAAHPIGTTQVFGHSQ